MSTKHIGLTFFSTDSVYQGQPGLGGGFDLFASGRIPTLGDSLGIELFNVSASHSNYSFSAHSWVEAYFGVAGPSWVTAFFAEGSYDGSEIALSLQGTDSGGRTVLNAASYAAAGLTIGLGVTFNLKIVLSAIVAWTPKTTCSDAWHCHTEWEPVWAKLANLDLSATIDIIDLIIQLVKALSGGGAESGSAGEDDVSWPTSNLGKGFDMFDSSFKLHSAGSVTLNPQWSKIIDITSDIPGLDGIKDFLATFGGGITAGPVIGFNEKVVASMTDVSIDGVKYGDLKFSGSQSSGTITGSKVGTSGTDSTDLVFGFSSKTSFDFDVGVGASVSLLKLFDVSDEATVGILSALGISPSTGTISQTLSASVPVSAPIASVVLDRPPSAHG